MNDMTQISQADLDYFNGANKVIATDSSVLVSSSPYLNDGPLRALIAQEMLRRNGKDLASTAYIPEVAMRVHAIEDTPAVDAMIAAEKEKNPDFKAWIDARVLSNFTADDVKGFAPGTLGATIHSFLTDSGYQIDYFFQGMPVNTDYDYYKKERTFTHDIEHMVTGFETDHASEIALLYANMECFYRYFTPELATEFCRIYAFLASKTMFKGVFYYPRSMQAQLEAIHRGVEMGRGWTKPLLMVNWWKHLDWTIEAIREEYGIMNAPPSGYWAWTSDAVQD